MSQTKPQLFDFSIKVLILIKTKYALMKESLNNALCRFQLSKDFKFHLKLHSSVVQYAYCENFFW